MCTADVLYLDCEYSIMPARSLTAAEQYMADRELANNRTKHMLHWRPNHWRFFFTIEQVWNIVGRSENIHVNSKNKSMVDGYES